MTDDRSDMTNRVLGARHTPGPWEQFERLTPSENSHGFIVRGNGTRIADVLPMCEENGDASEEAIANAKLIAAAPDLVAAVRGLIEVAEGKSELPWMAIARARDILGKVGP